MQEVPDEVALYILEQVPVEDLPAFCASSKKYRGLCSDRQLWYSIFEREGLVLLEEGTDLVSWLVIYRASVLAREQADYVLSLYQKKRRGWLDMFKRIPLYQIKSSRLLGEEDSELDQFISEDTHGKQLRDALKMQEAAFGTDVPLVEFSYLDRSVIPEENYLVVTKRGEEFVLTVEDKENEERLNRTIDQIKLRDILYRLAYHALLELDPTIFTVYTREKESQASRPRTRGRIILPRLTAL